MSESGAQLAVIDMQRVFGEPGSPWFTPRFAEVVDPIRRLVAVFDSRVTFTRFVAPAEPVGIWREYYQQWPFAFTAPDSPIYAVVEEFQPVAGPTVDATTFSKWNPELAATVSAPGPLVLAGVSTDCCVLSTALAAADAGIEVWVVADACAGVTDDSHQRALDILRGYPPHIQVVRVAEMLDFEHV